MSAFIKMLVYATIVPVGDTFSWQSVMHIQEVLQCAVSVIDVACMWFVYDWRFGKITGDKRIKIMVVGLGWATMDAILSHFLIFVLNASGGEFTWEYLQRSILANGTLLEYVALATLVWIFKFEGYAYKVIALLIGVGLIFVVPIQFAYLQSIDVLINWNNIAGKVLVTALLSVLAK